VTDFQVYGLTSVALLAIAAYSVVAQGNLIRKVLALNILGSSTFLLLVAIAGRDGPDGPDPVPHAMVLTGIVVAVSTTAFALALVRRLHAETGLDHLAEVDDE
jgi:multicomponent Na+:H+ antiporter subunit C